MVNRYIRDEVSDEVEYVGPSPQSNWLPLLLIPLFLLLALGAYTMYRADGTKYPTTPDDTNGMQYGVGGGPNVSPAETSPTLIPLNGY